MTVSTVPLPAEAEPLTGRWTDVFRRDALVHVGIMGSIAVATFQGYLKDRMGGPLPYVLADLLLAGAVAAWFGTIAVRKDPVRGPGYLPIFIFVVVAVPTLYLIHPTTPFVIELAGLRSWVAFPLACFMALSVIKNAAQVRAYAGLVIGLSLITGVYGIVQYLQGPTAALGGLPLGQLRHGYSVQYFDIVTGLTDFRAFSTFTFPAPFAAMMVFGMLLAAGAALHSSTTRRQRAFYWATIPILFIAMTVSGTRAALIMLLVGLFVIGMYRGFSARQLLLVPLLAAGLHAATLLTAGRAFGRYGSIITEGTAWSYVTSPISTGIEAVGVHPFGSGLGRTGVGVPFAITQAQPSGFFVFSDGDIGRAAVEMGLFGLLLLAIIVFGILPYASRAARALCDTPAGDVAVGAGAVVVGLGIIVLIGSPLATAPHGVIWWFFLGALIKLWMMQSEQQLPDA